MSQTLNKKREGWQWSDFKSGLLDTSPSVPLVATATATATVRAVRVEPFVAKTRNDLIEINQTHCAAAVKIEMDGDHSLELVPQKGCGQFLLHVQAGQHLVLVERNGDEAINLLGKIKLEQGATLKHVRIFDSSDKAQFFHYDIELAADSSYSAVVLTSGSLCQRSDSKIEFLGKGASAEVRMLALLGEGTHCDLGVDMLHLKPQTKSSFQARAVVAHAGQACFRPTGFIAEGAEETDLVQLTKALLLSEHARLNTKPELAIHNNNVECSHGVASASLDPHALFYLGARGVDEAHAKQILLDAFIAELFYNEAEITKDAQQRLRSIL